MLAFHLPPAKERAAVLALVCALMAGCGLLGGGDPPARLQSGIPGPFEEGGDLVLCLGDVRLDGPALRSTPSEGDMVGLCAAGGAAPSPCSADGECPGGERCVCGRCRSPACRTNSDCLPGHECRVQARRCMIGCIDDGDCPAGSRCDPTTLGCARECEADADCPFGEVCAASRGLCASIPCGDTSCSPGRECDLQRRIAVVSEPALLETDGEWMLWATVAGVGVVLFEAPPGAFPGAAAWRSEGAGPVLPPGMRDAAVARWSGGMMLVAGDDTASALHVFEGEDGAAWETVGDGVALDASDLGWEGAMIGRPSIARAGDGWVLAYEGGDGAGMGLAMLGDSGEASPVGGGPLVSPAGASMSGSWDPVSRVGSPALFDQECGGRRTGMAVLFEGFGLEAIPVEAAGSGPPDPNSSLGYARIDAAWEVALDPWNPFYSTMAGVGVTRSERGPAIACGEGDGWVLVYEVEDASTGLSRGLFWALPY